MNIGIPRFDRARLCRLAALIVLSSPIAARAQVMFAVAGPTNNATNTPNTAFGWQALLSNTSGNYNTAMGYSSLQSNSGGSQNTAYGFGSLFLNTVGNGNTAAGLNTLYHNTTGTSNTAVGWTALYTNVNGIMNSAVGAQALYSNTTGGSNTASGVQALYGNMTGGGNTANGFRALYSNTNGSFNTADGYGALSANTTGQYNTASGVNALLNNISGSNNVSVGISSLYNNTTGHDNIAIGHAAGAGITSGSNNIAIGNSGVSTETGAIRIGKAGTQTTSYIAGINGVTASNGVAVFINANGQLGTLTSSRRFKYDIKDMGSMSDKLMKLRPVAFRYKQAAEDGKRPMQYGLIAEEVAKVYPNLVQYDKAGKPFTIYYHLLTPMILNELQKEHRRNTAESAEIASLQEALKRQSTEIAALKQAQERQLLAMDKLRALVAETTQNRGRVQQAAEYRR